MDLRKDRIQYFLWGDFKPPIFQEEILKSLGPDRRGYITEAELSGDHSAIEDATVHGELPEHGVEAPRWKESGHHLNQLEGRRLQTGDEGVLEAVDK
ncbi:hypothetical protein R1sor_011828 [Riccia sorocarpa]|uniref:Uncharacterized protein n=1 Tax=Riccia sorocarpa TaxID=122646 RepID=A0ABD3I5Z4_9MARC